MSTRTNSVIAVLALFASVVLPLPSSAEQSIDLPSVAGILLRNDTGSRVVFQLESEHSDATEFSLEPGESRTYAVDGDTWMNVLVSSDGGEHSYGLDMGERAYFQWVGNDLRLINMAR